MRSLQSRGNRAALFHDQIDAFKENMKELPDLKFKCSKCRAKDFELFIVQSEHYWRQFLLDADIEHFRALMR